MSKLQIATALLVVAAVVGIGVGQFVGTSAAAPGDGQKSDPPADKKDENRWQEKATLKGHDDGVRRLAVSADGKVLASASDDSTVKVWNLATGKEVLTLKEPDGGGMRGVAIAPDGKSVATAGGDRAVRVWETSKGTQIQEYKGHTAPAFAVIFSPDGKTVVSGGGCVNYPDKGQNGYGEIRLWDPATGKELAAIQTHSDPVAHLYFSPDGKTLISGGYDNVIKLWDWDGKGQLKERLAITVGEGQGIYDMALSPDGKTLVVASEGTVKLYDVATGKQSGTALEKSEYRDGWLWGAVAFSPDGKTVAAASPIQEWEDKDKKFVVQRRSDVMLWDTATGKLLEKLRVDEPVTALAFSPDGKTLVTGCRGKTRLPEKIERLEDFEEEKAGPVKLWTLKK